jgi:hypothetical protein
MAAMTRRETDRKRAELGCLLNDPATPPDADRVRALLAAPMALATPRSIRSSVSEASTPFFRGAV